MAEFKVVLSDPKTGKSFQREIKEEGAKPFLGLKIGDAVKGELLDLTGYEFKISGGSDFAGFPMRWDVPGTGRKKIFTTKGVGVSISKKEGGGKRRRKTVAGNTIYAKTAQINMVIMKYGAKPLEEAPAEGAAPEKAE